MKRLSTRTVGLKQSHIRAVSQMVDAVGGINLGQGICDLPTPGVIRSAAREAIDSNLSTYSPYAGIPALRSYILRKARTFNRIPASSEDEVLVSVGSTGAFAMAMLVILDPGDEVILFEPYYGYHRNLILAAGGVPVHVAQREPEWTMDFGEIETAVTARTKAVVVTTPANPHGKVWSRQELASLLAIAERHDLWLVTDEIYEYLTYDGREHVSMASLAGAYERTITLSGFSKTFNMTGWRLGYAVAPNPVVEKMGLLSDLFYICAPTPLQHGVTAASRLDAAFYDEIRSSYSERRELMCTTLEEVGFGVLWPEGSYYVLADFTKLAAKHTGFEDDERACETLIRRCGVGAVAGSAFFSNPLDGRHRLRFCFAKELTVLEEACEGLRRGLA